MSYCYWRLNNLQKSILCINSAKRFNGCQGRDPQSKVPQTTVPQINVHFRNLVVKEMRLDILKAVAIYETRRRNSYSGSSADRMELQYSQLRRAATVIALTPDSDFSEKDENQNRKVEETKSIASRDDSPGDSAPSSSSRRDSDGTMTEADPEAAASSPTTMKKE